MLQTLRVKNYALIRDLRLDMDKGLLIVTGETGAGKSIILGALGLVLGERADSNVVEGHESKCVVEAEFDISAYALRPFFETHDLDFEKQCILRREISTQGKSRAFINDTPVTLQQLKELGEYLIDIHSQHETVSLKDKRYQVQLLDSFAGNEAELKQYRSALSQFKKQKKQLEELIKQEAEWRAEYEFHSFQLNELTEANLQEGEETALEEEQNRLAHASEIAKAAFDGAEGLRNQEGSAYALLREVEHLLMQQVNHESRFSDLASRLQSLNIELDDIASELEKIADSTQADDQRLEQIDERISLLFTLQKKHACASSAELIQKRFDLEDKTARVESLDQEKQQLEQAVQQSEKALKDASDALRASRNKAIPALQKNLMALLAEVGMPHAQVEIKMEALDMPGEDGPDAVSMLFSSNPGMPKQSVNKVASGGELSRLMLCFKSILAASKALPTLIFDEIDTGISGEVASKVGKMMKQMATGHQIISITHLPQIAALGDAHYLVYKEIESGVSQTYMRGLKEDERVKEVARMLSGDKMSDSALANARELMAD